MQRGFYAEDFMQKILCVRINAYDSTRRQGAADLIAPRIPPGPIGGLDDWRLGGLEATRACKLSKTCLLALLVLVACLLGEGRDDKFYGFCMLKWCDFRYFFMKS